MKGQASGRIRPPATASHSASRGRPSRYASTAHSVAAAKMGSLLPSAVLKNHQLVTAIVPAATTPASGPASRWPSTAAPARASSPPARATISHSAGAALPAKEKTVVATTGSGFHEGPSDVSSERCVMSRPQLIHAHGSNAIAHGSRSESAARPRAPAISQSAARELSRNGGEQQHEGGQQDDDQDRRERPQRPDLGGRAPGRDRRPVTNAPLRPRAERPCDERLGRVAGGGVLARRPPDPAAQPGERLRVELRPLDPAVAVAVAVAPVLHGRRLAGKPLRRP